MGALSPQQVMRVLTIVIAVIVLSATSVPSLATGSPSNAELREANKALEARGSSPGGATPAKGRHSTRGVHSETNAGRAWRTGLRPIARCAWATSPSQCRSQTMAGQVFTGALHSASVRPSRVHDTEVSPITMMKIHRRIQMLMSRTMVQLTLTRTQTRAFPMKRAL